MDGIILELVLQICAAMVGTVAFSLLFGVPRTYYPWCGIIGGVGCLFTDVAHVESRIGRFYSYNGCNFPFQGCGSETEVSGHYFSYIGHLSPCSGRRNLLDRVLSDYGAAQTGRLYRI